MLSKLAALRTSEGETQHSAPASAKTDTDATSGANVQFCSLLAGAVSTFFLSARTKGLPLRRSAIGILKSDHRLPNLATRRFPPSFIMRRAIAIALLCGASAASSEVPAGRGLNRPSLAPSARSSVYASKPTLQAAKAVAAPTITPSFYWALLPNFLYFVSLSFSAWSRRAAPLHILCPLIV